MTSVPAALRALLERRERDLLDYPDADEIVAEAVAEMVQVLLDEAVVDIDELLDNQAITNAFGGAGYVRAVLGWRDAERAWVRSRRRRKDPRPAPPVAPQT